MESCCQLSVFPAIARADVGESSMRLAQTSRMRSSASRKTDVISRMARDSLFGAETREEVDRLARLVRKIGGNAWKVRRSVAPTAAAIMPAFLKIRSETN